MLVVLVRLIWFFLKVPRSLHSYMKSQYSLCSKIIKSRLIWDLWKNLFQCSVVNLFTPFPPLFPYMKNITLPYNKNVKSIIKTKWMWIKCIQHKIEKLVNHFTSAKWSTNLQGCPNESNCYIFFCINNTSNKSFTL